MNSGNNFVQKPATFKHMANIGDVIACLAAVKKYYEATNRKVVFCQMLNAPGGYYMGAVHPTVDENGVQVTMNQLMFDMIKPLVEYQPCIERFEKFEGQEAVVDLDVIRGKTQVNMPHGMLAAWPFYAFPDLAIDLSKPWLEISDLEDESILSQVRGKIVVNFTERYRSNIVHYYFLKKYSHSLIFSGTDREHHLFMSRWNLNIPKLQISNFLELAYALKNSRFLLSNQSMQWNLCEAAKLPRLLEVCAFADNCQPFVGKDSFGFFYQEGLEYYFNEMFERLK